MTRRLGIVLAGGGSTRFGSDKAEALLHGKRLIDHAADSLRPWCETVMLVGRRDPDFATLADRPAPDMGPLGGLNAGLHFASENGFDRVVSVGCDTPALPADLLQRLCAAERSTCLARTPIVGCWHVVLAADLDTFLAEPCKHAVRAWIERVDVEAIDADAILNINRREDLIAAEGAAS